MREAVGDLWDLVGEDECLVITTNGDVNSRGWAVMGRGIAKEAATKLEADHVKEHLGRLVALNGNHAYYVYTREPFGLVTMPVKHHWHENADLALIERSALEVLRIVDEQGWTNVWMPRPGCGNGGLRWPVVRSVLEPILDDRFIVVTNQPDGDNDDDKG